MVMPNEVTFGGDPSFEEMGLLFLPEAPSFEDDGDDEFTEEFLFHMSTPITPYQMHRVAERQKLWCGTHSIFYPPGVYEQLEMLDEWWTENEPDLPPNVRGIYAKRRLQRHRGVVG